MYLPTPEVAALQWVSKSEFVPQDTSTNIFIAAFTTAWARMKLYSEMDKLGQKVLYHDTDSIVYASDGVSDPPCGNFLGEFTDELNGGLITTFVSGQYYFSELSLKFFGYRLRLILYSYIFRRPKELCLRNHGWKDCLQSKGIYPKL